MKSFFKPIQMNNKLGLYGVCFWKSWLYCFAYVATDKALEIKVVVYQSGTSEFLALNTSEIIMNKWIGISDIND